MALDRVKSVIAVFALLLVISFLTACGQAVNPAQRDAAQIAGAWHVTAPIAIETYITQKGGSYSAQNVSAPGTCVNGGTMIGSAQGDIVTLTFVSPSTPTDSITLQGTHDHSLIYGSNVVMTGTCNAEDTTISAQHIGSVASNSWSGGLDGTTAVTVKAKLTVDSLGNTSGTLTFSGDFCLPTVDVSGSQVGDTLILTDGKPAPFVWQGIVNASGKGIAGSYSGACGSGTFTMIR
jgi:hypothetical protein